MDRPNDLTPDALARWIPQLASAGRLDKFYHTPEFQTLRREVLEAAHGECEDCRAKVPSQITPATMVHHDKPVRQYPRLALARTWVDDQGRRHKQLWALCHDCHERRHGRCGYTARKPKPPPLTPERW